MNKKKHRIRKLVIIICLVIFTVDALLLIVRAVGKAINKATPKDGINESMYVEINGVKQWINIYGENQDNSVLLYLHGGPGSSTSSFDYVITRKLADVYTVVTWDQRNCGKSYDESQNQTLLTRELLMQDGKELTEYLLEYMKKDKITILGHSWGSIYGANLVLEYPQYYDCFIGAGQMVDRDENEEAFKQAALIWAGDDEESLKMVNQLTPDAMSMEHINAKNALMKKYGYDMMVNGADYSLLSAVIFNPNYSVIDWVKYLNIDSSAYLDFLFSDEFKTFSLKGKTEYEVPFYNINGDRDYQTNYQLAQEYFDAVNAPHKQMFMMENMTHGLLESRSDDFSKIVHNIAVIEAR